MSSPFERFAESDDLDDYTLRWLNSGNVSPEVWTAIRALYIGSPDAADDYAAWLEELREDHILTEHERSMT